MTANHDRQDTALASLDAFAALADGRQQLLAAVAASEARGAGTPAETLKIVAAHDHALRLVALAYAQGARDFSACATPATLAAQDDGPCTLETVEAARASFFEAVAAVMEAHAEWLDDVIETPWEGRATWRMHLLALAMHDGAQAYALTEPTS
ncbi:MAG: hypothetical protein M0R73_06015 [Dehalococcoidia bacterium]|nr:hypothetical protein [Dehalococcoidia bacterium]